jgi:hypothetical protein
MLHENRKIKIITLGVMTAIALLNLWIFNCFKFVNLEHLVGSLLFLLPSMSIAFIFYIFQPWASIVGSVGITAVLIYFLDIKCALYTGGGASMIEIPIFMFTFIASLVGCVLGYLISKE